MTVKRMEMGYSGRKTCVNCLVRSRHWVSFQDSWFRGDDYTMNLCKRCQNAMTDDEIEKLHMKAYPHRFKEQGDE